jgi:hypothetical protein
MAEKRIPYRFTIGFSPGDPAHQTVADLLNQQGRRKAQFLVNAVLHYIHCPETPEIPEVQIQPAQVDLTDIIEQVVDILKEQGYFKEAAPALDGEQGQDSLLDAAGMAAISDSLAAFRGK